ncbi:hypothetical protein N7478_012640 [Penicillium angulare]|uniref:uncharacterized protein n=1 Tax=Penicillium angulare TaxID=116970 RepID=UPI0025420D44|nr:uncharacterized protein N7478_012640 [Penicillium angulare]KAJ5256536.1 hypothetical protein N7478_012640 [Penicillium angulare]
MQFALPPRKSPHRLPSSQLPPYRRTQLKTIAVCACVVLSILYLLSYFFSADAPSIGAPVGTSGVVIVTLLDREHFSESYIKKIVTNREDYANRHGYTNFFVSLSDYDEAVGDSPKSWATVPAVRHAMASYPHAAHFFHLSPHALIMNPSRSLKSLLLDNNRIESLMLKDLPVVPPDSIIKTFSHLKEKDVDLVITQDSEDLNPSSFILRNGDFARFFLDLWFDPLFRNYNFAKAEAHGLYSLERRWCPSGYSALTVKTRMAQVLMASITTETFSFGSPGATIYKLKIVPKWNLIT